MTNSSNPRTHARLVGLAATTLAMLVAHGAGAQPLEEPAEGAAEEPAAPAPAAEAPAEAPAAPAEPAPAAQPVEPPAAAAEPVPAPALPEAAPPPAEPVPEAEPVATDAIDPKVNFGVGLRVQYAFSPDGVGGQNFAHAIGTNLRPYISGQANKYIKFEANLDSATDFVVGPGDVAGDGTVTGFSPLERIRPLDAVIKFELHEYLNFWMGRFLPPSDRANLSGPYYQNSWNYPVQSNLYPAIYAGRHDGVAYWGQYGEGRFKWQLGMFDVTGGDNPLLAGRLTLNILDTEPGYYNSSTYYGEKDVLAIGVVGMAQDGGVPGTGIDGEAFNVDALFEKELDGSGTISVEAAYYNFEGADQGSSFWGLLAYLIPAEVGIGRFQPNLRIQNTIPDAGDSFITLDGGVNYIINGHNARLALVYQHIAENNGFDAANVITFGGQLQL